MSNFIVSARKYRPMSFQAVVGQKSITSILQKSIESDQLAQSYLFCGPRGVGKTTCARIFAKEINKFTNDADLENFSFNIFELDAASNNSVEDIRNLTEQVRVPPQVGKYKVYIIDEVHMLSQSAFNAFLKTLEEPPKHAKFILATTEKHKIIPTILSRCQIFDFKRIGDSDIVEYLNFVAKEENIEVDQESLRLIAQKSDGALRDSLSLFDRLCNWTEKTLFFKRVVKLLNVLDYEYYFKLTENLIAENFHKVLSIFNEIIENGYDGQEFVVGLAKHFRDLLVSKDAKTIDLLELGDELQQRYLSQSKLCSVDFLLSSLNICSDVDVNYKNSSNQRLLVELMLLRIFSVNEIAHKKKTLTTKKKVFEDNDIKSEKTKNLISPEEEVVELKHTSTNVSIDLNSIKKPSTILINSIEQKKEQIEKISDIDQALKTEDFSEEEMLNKWVELIKYFKKLGKSNVALALEINSPKLLPEQVIHIFLSNAAQREIILDEKHTILDFLRENLKNKTIEISLEILKNVQQKTPYTNKDKFNQMVETNKYLENLKQKLSLDTDY
ncbi:MAG: DNA polymerase III subunit gamma/tau [Bacteroidota bacterium]|nr:DNA polymerase III subunit gamma/tau [Bacteroidota bacterium]